MLSFLGTAYFEVDGELATIDTIAVHPDTLRWYESVGFTDGDHYLHIYADSYAAPPEPDRAVTSVLSGVRPVAAFLHGRLADEEAMRERFARVHVCRRYSMPL